MITELIRLFLLPMLREEGRVLKPPKPKWPLDNDGVTFYSLEGVDGEVLVEIPGVGLLLAPESVTEKLRGAPPRQRRRQRIYMMSREFTSEGLRKLLEEAAKSGEEEGGG